ncbi:MAG: hypothetical protein IPK67_14470 [Planctomycetes bacterium]|nr:hypothetical protein [Planctomycetota bacterium]
MQNRTQARYFPHALTGLSLCAAAAFPACSATGSDDSEFQREFGVEQRSLANTGRNAFFVLEPGFQLVLADDDARLTITVLDQTEQIAGVATRVVEEREEEEGELVEVSRNYFAIDPRSGDVFYFGEDVDVFEHGKLTGHPGAWRAGTNGARAGLAMPGAPRVGTRYYQEIAPGVAMDRAEVVDLRATLETPAGRHQGCLKTRETNALSENETEFKLYAPGVGLIQDEDLLLVSAGPARAETTQKR